MSIHASNQRSNLDRPAHRIGFFRESSVGKTTVSTLVADRLSERGQVSVLGDTSEVLESGPMHSPSTSTGVRIRWTIQDAKAGITSVERPGPEVDTACVVATPDGLDSVWAYERTANRSETDLFLIVTRVTEASRDRIRACDGPELAEYCHEDEAISTAMAANRVPSLANRTVEAILVEALQPERLDLAAALDALETKQRSLVNIEVTEAATAAEIGRRLRSLGLRAAFFNSDILPRLKSWAFASKLCNCQCHDGHVIARLPPGDRGTNESIGKSGGIEVA